MQILNKEGDGLEDVIVGPVSAKKSYAVFGSNSLFSATMTLASLDGCNGFSIVNIFTSPTVVSYARDVKNDNRDDLIIEMRSLSIP